MNRRDFLKGMAGILASGFAPAVVGSGVLMPVRKIWTPPRKNVIWGLEEFELDDPMFNAVTGGGSNVVDLAGYRIKRVIDDCEKKVQEFCGIYFDSYPS